MKRIHIAIIVNIVFCILLYMFSSELGKTLYVTKLNREKVTELLRDSKVRIEDNMKVKKVKTSQGIGEIYLTIYCEGKEKIESYISENNDKFSPYIKTRGISRNLLYTISKITLFILISLVVKDKINIKRDGKPKTLTKEDDERLRNI